METGSPVKTGINPKKAIRTWKLHPAFGLPHQQTTLGHATALVRSTEVNTYVQRPFFGVFENLPAGDHTVSIWARASSGSATGVLFDPGCWNSAGVNYLLVTES